MPSSSSKSNGTYAIAAAGAVAATYACTRAYRSRIQEEYDDGIDLKSQTIEIDPVEHIRRCTFYTDIDIFSFHKTLFPTVKTLGDVLQHGFLQSNDGPCMGYIDERNEKETISWIPYSTALQRTRFIGSHLWTHARLTPMKSIVVVISSNRPEYSFVEHACYIYGFTLFSLYTNYNSTSILSVLDRTKADVLVVDNLDRIRSFKNQLLEKSYIKEILVMDDISSNENAKIQSMPIILKEMQQSDVRARPFIDPDTVATFFLTSGTTGM